MIRIYSMSSPLASIFLWIAAKVGFCHEPFQMFKERSDIVPEGVRIKAYEC